MHWEKHRGNYKCDDCCEWVRRRLRAVTEPFNNVVVVLCFRNSFRWWGIFRCYVAPSKSLQCPNQSNRGMLEHYESQNEKNTCYQKGKFVELYIRRNDSNWIPTDFLGKRDRWKYSHHNTQDLSCYIQSHAVDAEAFQDNTWHGTSEDGRHNLIKSKISLGIFSFAKYKWPFFFVLSVIIKVYFIFSQFLHCPVKKKIWN